MFLCRTAIPLDIAECLRYMAGYVQVCGSSSWILPLGLALPYAWRLAQCLRVYRDTGARPQLFNALKYSTAFPVILFSALKYQARPPNWGVPAGDACSVKQYTECG